MPSGSHNKVRKENHMFNSAQEVQNIDGNQDL